MSYHSLSKLVSAIAAVGLLAVWPRPASAQTEVRSGVLPLNQMEVLSDRRTTLSQGYLADLQIDPNFQGNFQIMVDAATTILDGYRVVNRGGGFPENAGIPLDQQLTVAETAYRLFILDGGNELVLYRTPQENTSRYFIRTPSSATGPGTI